ncbi:MAG: deoxynucleoside kinase [Flavobacteriales bacterium]|nr:deoxynucleoside kinase [Flavobacteriales bacterium]MCB9198416.1 deoxynucleoside kinase [Flavobacteriales bacterium]
MIKYNYIAIEGNIGAGKSTLAKFLHRYFGGGLLLEEFEENESLKDFYENPEFALNAELQFVLDRSRQLFRFHQKANQFIIADYIPLKSLIFARNNLPKKEFGLYEPIAMRMLKDYPQPDLILFLDRDLDELQENIKKRGREYEQTVSNDYLQGIQDGYENYLFDMVNVPILKIQAKEIDLKRQDVLASAFQRIFQTEYATAVRKVDLKVIMNSIVE